MDAMPSARQASRFTRGSGSALSQRSNWPRETLSPVNPERTCSRAPTAGADDPALARQTISSPCGRASARPVAPVMYCARSTNNCRVESNSLSSSPCVPLDLSPMEPIRLDEPVAPTDEAATVADPVADALADNDGSPPVVSRAEAEFSPVWADSGWADPCIGNMRRAES